MLSNYERVIKSFIPAFRLRAAHMMVRDYGLKQQQAANMLGTTQAAISKYLKESSEKYSDVKIDTDYLREFVENMKTGDEKMAQKAMCTMCQSNKKFDCAFIVK